MRQSSSPEETAKRSVWRETMASAIASRDTTSLQTGRSPDLRAGRCAMRDHPKRSAFPRLAFLLTPRAQWLCVTACARLPLRGQCRTCVD